MADPRSYSSPSDEEPDSEIENFVERVSLGGPYNEKWGYVIVRPSSLATPEYDEKWAAAMRNIRKGINVAFNAGRTFASPPRKPLPDEKILPMKQLRLPIVTLKMDEPDMQSGHGDQLGSLDDAMIHSSRKLHTRWLAWYRLAYTRIPRYDKEEQKKLASESRNHLLEMASATDGEDDLRLFTDPGTLFLLVDRYALESLAADDLGDLSYLLAVHSREDDIGEQHYLGWMRIQPILLDRLFEMRNSDDFPRDCMPEVQYEGQIPIYDDDGPDCMVDPPAGRGPRIPLYNPAAPDDRYDKEFYRNYLAETGWRWSTGS